MAAFPQLLNSPNPPNTSVNLQPGLFVAPVASMTPAFVLATVTNAAFPASSPAGSYQFSTVTTATLAVDITFTSFTGGTSPAITFEVDREGADGNWYKVWASSAVNAAGTVSVSIGPVPTETGPPAAVTAALTGTARLTWSSTGTPTSWSGSFSIVGR